ncbi:hypothetical protein MNBD_ALPHA04-522, partial [hydrothermal vent metagenome]
MAEEGKGDSYYRSQTHDHHQVDRDVEEDCSG